MAWVLLIAGGLMALTPGFLDPVNAPVNGLTLLGVLVMFSGVVVAVRQQ
jgi:starvation-inducible outer membrane lipoprotein